MDRNRSSRHGSNVEDEVQKMLRKSVNPHEFSKLREKYSDADLVDKIQRAYLEKHANISKKAKKFAQLIREKFGNEQYPFHLLLEKARLFKVKYNLTDDEFAEFQRIYEQELVGVGSTDVYVPITNMTKVLGSVKLDFKGFDMKLSDSEYRHLQEILKLYASSRPLHAQVLLQSIQYTNLSYEAMTGKYIKQRHSVNDHVHPVVAALFLPKIQTLETHFLHSNIAGIVKARYNGEALATRPDYELFYSLINDPNDIVCDNNSTVLDLLNRAQLQNQLWNSVLNLRNGHYYNASFRDFVNSVDMCKLNKYDNPDLVYGRYDGTILKRLISAFSFRPTIVAVTPIVTTTASINPYLQSVRPVVSSIPMINIRLPLKSLNKETIDLGSALDTPQLFREKDGIVLRQTNIIYSREVVIFFVDRRSNIVKFANIQPFNVSKLPIAISGFERMNDDGINVPDTIEIRGDTFELCSLVASEINNTIPGIEQNVVVGSSSVVVDRSDFGANYFMYNPTGVIGTFITKEGDKEVDTNNTPITQIRATGGEYSDFDSLKSTRGIVFIYKLKGVLRELNEYHI